MAEARTSRREHAGAIRRADIEPYTALRWLGTLFKAAAVFLAIAIFTEFVIGLQAEGMAALPQLLGELARTIVFAVVLWGAGDLVRLLINMGNDVRAQRVLLARVSHRTAAREEDEEASVAIGRPSPPARELGRGPELRVERRAEREAEPTARADAREAAGLREEGWRPRLVDGTSRGSRPNSNELEFRASRPGGRDDGPGDAA